MDWNKAKATTEANAYVPQNNSPSGGDSPFAKFESGVSIIRPISVGNYEEDIPFRHVQQHSAFNYVGNKTNGAYALCWDWLFSTESNRIHIAKPLMSTHHKLTQQDFNLWKEYGCPFCAAAQFMRTRKEKTMAANLFPKSSYMWNIIVRANPVLGTEERIQIWSPSQKNHQILMETAENAYQGGAGIDIFNPATGFDWQLTATGEKNLRRYSLSLIPVPKPITIAHTPYDLTEIMIRNFKTYQETIDMLNAHYAEAFSIHGYRPQGDATYAVRQVDPYAQAIKESAINNQANVPRETPQPVVAFPTPATRTQTVSAIKPTLTSPVVEEDDDFFGINTPVTKQAPPFTPDPPKQVSPKAISTVEEDDFWGDLTNSSPHNIPVNGEVKGGKLFVGGKEMF